MSIPSPLEIKECLQNLIKDNTEQAATIAQQAQQIHALHEENEEMRKESQQQYQLLEQQREQQNHQKLQHQAQVQEITAQYEQCVQNVESHLKTTEHQLRQTLTQNHSIQRELATTSQTVHDLAFQNKTLELIRDYHELKSQYDVCRRWEALETGISFTLHHSFVGGATWLGTKAGGWPGLFAGIILGRITNLTGRFFYFEDSPSKRQAARLSIRLDTIKIQIKTRDPNLAAGLPE